VTGAGIASTTITDNDTAVFSLRADASGREDGGPIQFIIDLSHPVDETTSVTVSTADGTAKARDNDYTPLVDFVVTFAAGQTSATVQVFPAADRKVEDNETFTIRQGSVSGGHGSVSALNTPRVGTIRDSSHGLLVQGTDPWHVGSPTGMFGSLPRPAADSLEPVANSWAGSLSTLALSTEWEAWTTGQELMIGGLFGGTLRFDYLTGGSSATLEESPDSDHKNQSPSPDGDNLEKDSQLRLKSPDRKAGESGIQSDSSDSDVVARLIDAAMRDLLQSDEPAPQVSLVEA
jgi:hypothetical protein